VTAPRREAVRVTLPADVAAEVERRVAAARAESGVELREAQVVVAMCREAMRSGASRKSTGHQKKVTRGA